MNRVLIAIFLLLSLCANAQVQLPPYVISKDSLPNYLRDKNWRFTLADDPAMALPGYDDSKWDLVSPELQYSNHPKQPADTFNSLCWLRFHFRTDSTTSRMPLALSVTQYGASELYLDGRKIASYGKVAPPDSVVYFDPQRLPLIITLDTGVHILAVRYANYFGKLNALRNYRRMAGISIVIMPTEQAVKNDHWASISYSTGLALLFGFFLTFCIVHLFYYFFQRSTVSNLYFSLLCFCVCCCIVVGLTSIFLNNPRIEIMNSFLILVFLSLIVLSFSGFINHLFSSNRRRFRVVAIVCILLPFVMLVLNRVGYLALLAMVVFVVLEGTVLTVKAIVKGTKGARIIGTGILLTTLFIIANIIFLIATNDNFNIDGDNFWGKIYLFSLGTAILGMPIFMSIFLARDYAQVNKGLKLQLAEVERLSRQALEQELEKKHLLENQNELLEREVATRTAEVMAQKREIEVQHEELKREKRKSDELLLNILPEEVADELKETGSSRARAFSDVTVIFTDFVDFTHAGERLSAVELVDELHTCFKAFDEIMARHGIEKIKTIGDAYLAVCGLPVPAADHAIRMATAAIEVSAYMAERKRTHGDKSFDIRIGLHSGSVVAGIVGVKKFAYDIWGDTVNTAARLEQHGVAGKINVSQATYELVKDHFACTFRGKIQAKNKGELSMYFIERKIA